MNDKVVFLAFKNPNTALGNRDLIACKACNNKTYVILRESEDAYPLVECTACHAHIGHIGWVEE